MRASLVADYSVIEGGPLTSVAEGGEDVRGLLLAASWLLWPNGVDTWFPQGGFSCSLDQIEKGVVELSLEALPLSGEDDLPVASMSLTIEAALARSANISPREFSVHTEIPSTDGPPDWAQLNWAGNLARGSGSRGTLCVGVRDSAGAQYQGDSSFWDLVEEQLHVPDVPFGVQAAPEGGWATIREIAPSLLNFARTIDAVRSALAITRPGESVAISVAKPA